MTTRFSEPNPTPTTPVDAVPTDRVRVYRGRHRPVRRLAPGHAIASLHRHGLRAAQTLGAMVLFAATVAAANWLTAHYGLVPVGFGLTAVAGAYATGFCLLARDWVHDTVGRPAVLAAIAAGTVTCAATAVPQVALATAIAFAVSEVVDLLVYQPLRRHGFIRAALASNAAGAAIDTVLYLTFVRHLSWANGAGQLVAQATATSVPLLIVLTARTVVRHRNRTLQQGDPR